MVSSNIRHRFFLIAAVLVTLQLTSCREGRDAGTIPISELIQLVNADVFDTTSVFFGDYLSYPENISKLPVGLFSIGGYVDELLYHLQTRDKFDNITGEALSDDLPDMAGENFVTFTMNDCAEAESGGNPMDLSVLHVLFLTGNDFFEESQQTKILVAGGMLDDVATEEKIGKFLSHTNTGVKYISVAGSTARTLIDSLGDNPDPFAVLFLGETETIKKDIYPEHLGKAVRERGLANNIPVVSQSISDADAAGIPMIEAALMSLLKNYCQSETTIPIKALIVEPDIDNQQVDELISILNYYRNSIFKGITPYKSLISEDVLILNPAACAATECYKVLRGDRNLALSITEQQVSRFSYPSGFSYGF